MLTLTRTSGQQSLVEALPGEPFGDGWQQTEVPGRGLGCTMGCLSIPGLILAVAGYEFAGTIGAVIGVVPVLVLMGIALIHGLMAKSVAEPANVVVTPWPIVPGQPVEIRLGVQMKKTLRVRRLTARVTGEEEAKYRVGTTTHTVDESIFDEALESIEYDPVGETPPPAAGEAILARWTITLPNDAPPTLGRAPFVGISNWKMSNSITWLLTIEIEIDKHPDRKAEFPLLVC